MSVPVQRKWLYALVVSASVLGLAEWVARGVDAELPGWSANDNPSVVMTGHPTRLWGLAAGERTNVDTVATVDPVGLRGPIPSAPRATDEERVLVLGDSSFFGFGVADDQTMAAHLQRRLDGVSVINGAIPGYSTEQSLRLMDEVGWSLEPTLLLVANFWSDTNFEPFQDRDLLATADASQVGMLAHSALLRWLAIGVSRLMPGSSGQIVTWPRGKPLPDATVRRVPVADYAANLDTLIRDAESRGIGVVLFTPPSPVEIENKVRPPHQWEPYRAAQKAVAALHGIPHVDSTAAFAAAVSFAPEKGLEPWFLDDLHPTADGQRLMAKLVGRTLKARGWPEDRVTGRPDADFDRSAFVDTTPASRAGRPTGDRSPISNLFGGSGASPASKTTAQTAPQAAAKLSLSVSGGQPPYMLTVQSAGQTVASARLNEPRTVELDAPRGELVIAVTDAEGVRRTQELSGNERSASLSF
jgi:lysophospholipase L1-like esterase